MAIIDYKEKYEKAVQAAMLAKQDTESAVTIGILEEIFPELKESEGERIKKSIIEHLKCDIDDMAKSDNAFEYEAEIEELSKYIAWLEKQGEQKPIDPDTLIQQRVDALADIVADQKPADNVEPKFKVGDWVVNTITGNVEQIIEVTSNEYVCSGVLIVSFDNQHLLKKWTIQDAKDGNILVCGKEKRPFIFKGLLDKFHPDNPVAYCGIDCGNEFFIYIGTNWWTDEEVEPANKEQRDLLFQKMKEEGYEWDAEKKELKKIEHNNSAWSEEDELRMENILSVIEGHGYPMEVEWLKSIKCKSTWKPSDVQLRALKEACDEHWEPDGLDPLYALYQNLKKLREE